MDKAALISKLLASPSEKVFVVSSVNDHDNICPHEIWGVHDEWEPFPNDRTKKICAIEVYRDQQPDFESPAKKPSEDEVTRLEMVLTVLPDRVKELKEAVFKDIITKAEIMEELDDITALVEYYLKPSKYDNDKDFYGERPTGPFEVCK